MTGDGRACFHCGIPIPIGTVIHETQGEELLDFCCRGCRGAYLLITGSGLGDFYHRRIPLEQGGTAEAFSAEFSDSELARYAYALGEHSGIDIIIDGIHCASCVWLNEKIIGRMNGVRAARVNYATSRARVVFDSETITPAAIFTRIAELGYLPRPFTLSAAEESANREKKDLLIRFGTAFFLTMQLMAYSVALYAGYFQGMGSQIKLYLQLFSLLVTTPVIFYSGLPFLRGAWRGVANGVPDMDLLISIGALSSFCYSIYAMFMGEEVYFETAAMIVTLILAGRLLENLARRRAAGGVERLLGLTRGQARRFAGETLETVDVSALQTGDLILVGSGERFPVDGRIVEGTTDVDESPATGEPLPVPKTAGDAVIAGSLNITGSVQAICDKPSGDSFVARVARLVEEAQARRAPIQGITDRTAAFFVPMVLLLAAGTFAWHYYQSGAAGGALMTALAVVVIACPCALGLATPTAIVAGTGAAAAAGVIFKGGDVLENLSRITVAIFDKTGTITCGKPAVTAVCPADGQDALELASLAAAVEAGTLHPIGRAVCDHALRNHGPCLIGRDLRSFAGGGVSGTVAQELVAVGNGVFLAGLGVTGIPQEDVAPPGGTTVHVARAGRYAGSFTVQDKLRDNARNAVDYFRSGGVRSLLLSGDRHRTACHVAGSVGIGEGIGAMLPADKAALVEQLRGRSERVLMVGDGINDAPALSAADVGCAIAGGTDIAMETSDLVLAKPDLERLAFAHRIARRTMTVIRQNLCWAFAYNLIGIPLAMTGRLTPVYAAAAMALSSLCVVGNSLRLTVVKDG